MNANEIKFGIEIETTVPFSETQYDVADQIRIGGYHNGIKQPWLPGSKPGTEWKCESDSSIRNCPSFGRDRAESACEFISPILRGAEGLKNVIETVNKIKARGGKINSKCGIHITVSFPSDNAAALARLICLVANHEKAIYASTGTKNREQGIYCKPIKHFGEAKKVTDKNTFSTPMHDRFHILNLTHLADGYDRVEFRCFSGSLNESKIIGWILLVLSLTEKALKTSKCTSWTSKSRGDAKYNLDKSGVGITEWMRLSYLIGWTCERALSDGMKALREGIGAETWASAKQAMIRLVKKYDAE